ncbi:MAG: anti-anti-sigma factor [candidate division Zixibacteria bacterium SM23_81]|nr:MAG: anti-anti-sigma factor [candidate division Zixibacteria bacterium SM23_81]
MAIKESVSDGIAVLALKGKLMGGPDPLALHDRVHGLIGDGIKQVVVDLGNVKWLNSSGLGALMASLTTLRNAGGDLKLAKVGKKIESLLLITKLISVFEIYDSVDRAAASFGK